MRVVLFLLVLLMAGSAQAAEQGDQHKGDGLGLPDDIREILQLEMRQIRLGMESLVWLVASGDLDGVAKVGHQLRDGYVMKRELTAEQRNTLVERLPEGFKKLDQQFHQYAGMLAGAAQKRDVDLVGFYIYKMNDVCVACHSGYVADRFEGFAKPFGRAHH